MDRLRPYQLEDAKKLAAQVSGGCFNQQRTGKTPTAIAACRLKGCEKILIVCPASALYQWQDEIEIWTGKPCAVAIGKADKRAKIINEQWEYALVISHGSLKQTTTAAGSVNDILKAKPDAVILDEAHRLKDRRSAISTSMYKLSKIPYKLALTGTPAPNRSYDIWGILHFLYPKTFRSYWKFIEENYTTSEGYNANTNQTFTRIGKMKKYNARMFQEFLDTYTTSRKRADVMQWLPDKDYRQIKLPLTDEQRRYLDELNTYFRTEHIVTEGLLDRLIRLRQICLDPALLELPGASPKIAWIKQYLKDYPDKQVLIFSKFTSFIHNLKKVIGQAKVVVGDTPPKEREAIRQNFQAGKTQVLILNLDACKEAMTLDAADVAIFTDKFPPVGSIDQAEDRFVATTEARADKEHTIIELMMKDSYEEELYKMIEARKEETDIINNYKYYLERRSMIGNSKI